MPNSASVQRFDFLVIGSGLAGLTYALHAAERGRVAVLTKGEVTESNTTWAQGGIAAAVGEADSWELHERDTLVAGAGLCDERAVRHLVRNAPNAIAWLQKLGARFDAEGDDLSLGREGGHGMNRIVHYQDRTGWEIERTVSEAVRSNPNITIFPHAFRHVASKARRAVRRCDRPRREPRRAALSRGKHDACDGRLWPDVQPHHESFRRHCRRDRPRRRSRRAHRGHGVHAVPPDDPVPSPDALVADHRGGAPAQAAPCATISVGASWSTTTSGSNSPPATWWLARSRRR